MKQWVSYTALVTVQNVLLFVCHSVSESLCLCVCSPMLGEYTGYPAWKMKEDESDEEDTVDAMFAMIRSPSHTFDDCLASAGLNDLV